MGCQRWSWWWSWWCQWRGLVAVSCVPLSVSVCVCQPLLKRLFVRFLFAPEFICVYVLQYYISMCALVVRAYDRGAYPMHASRTAHFSCSRRWCSGAWATPHFVDRRTAKTHKHTHTTPTHTHTQRAYYTQLAHVVPNLTSFALHHPLCWVFCAWEVYLWSGLVFIHRARACVRACLCVSMSVCWLWNT